MIRDFTEKQKRRLKLRMPTEERFLAVVILLLAIIIGFIVRWNFIAGSDFPINDGGLFYSLITDLIENKFRLPRFTTYNLAEIPNSYPPLAFYLAGAINVITGIPVMKLLYYVPFGISVLTIPVFYTATKTFFPKEHFIRALATFLFATLPRSFEWFVMGGGLTRSLGFIFALSAIAFYAKGSNKNRIGIELFLAGLFGSLTVLSHPIAGLFLAFSVLILTLYYWPMKISFPILFGLFVVIGSSPWWGTVLLNNGLSPFIGAANTGHSDWLDVGYLLTLNFNFENRFFLPLVSFMAILGLFSSQRKKSIYLGVLIGLGYLIVPRGGIDLLTSYLALLGALGFSVITKAWGLLEVNLEDNKNALDGFGRRSRILLFFLVIYSSIGAYSYKYIDGKTGLHLTEGDYQAMLWVREHTEENAKVMHLPPASNYQDWWNDYFGEWMPVGTERHSVATVQGYEWLPGEFGLRIEQYVSLRSCTGQGVDCVENWVITYDNEFDYLLLCKRQHTGIIIDNFLESPDYLRVYENEDVLVIMRNKGKS